MGRFCAICYAILQSRSPAGIKREDSEAGQPQNAGKPPEHRKESDFDLIINFIGLYYVFLICR